MEKCLGWPQIGPGRMCFLVVPHLADIRLGSKGSTILGVYPTSLGALIFCCPCLLSACDASTMESDLDEPNNQKEPEKT